jgi:hypothetical protein
MVKNTKKFAGLLASIAIGMCVMGTSAVAISGDLAKKCRDLAIEAHPYKLPGEKGPGTAQAQRDYFKDCVTKGGNMSETETGGLKN